MRTLIAVLTAILAAPVASANCVQIYDTIEYVCYVDGGRQVQVDIPSQEICGATYTATINKMPVNVLAGPLSRRDGGVEFDIAGPSGTTQTVGPCVENRIDIIGR